MHSDNWRHPVGTAVSAVKLEIPGQVSALLPMVAIDLSIISKILGEPIDFILGGDILRQRALSLDIAGRRLKLGPSGIAPSGYKGTPVKLIRSTPFFTVWIDGRPITALLDFGSNSDIDLTPEIWAKIEPAGAIISNSVNGDLAGNLVVVGKVRLAHMRIAEFDERDLDVRSDLRRRILRCAAPAPRLVSASLIATASSWILQRTTCG